MTHRLPSRSILRSTRRFRSPASGRQGQSGQAKSQSHAAGKGVNVAACWRTWSVHPSVDRLALGARTRPLSSRSSCGSTSRTNSSGWKERLVSESKLSTDPSARPNDRHQFRRCGAFAERHRNAPRSHRSNQRGMVVIAGSLPPGVETTIYRELAQSLKARQKKVALDTSGETLNHAIKALPTS